MKKRYISLLSAVCLSLFPFSTAYAEGDGGPDPIYEAVKQFGSETDYLTYVNYSSLVKAEKESNKAYADFLDRCSDSELFEEPAKKYTDTMFAGRCLGISLLEIMAHNGLIRPSDIQEGAVNMTDIELDDTARYYTDYYQSVQLHRDFDLYFKWYLSRYGRAERVEKLLETAEKAAEDKKYFLIMIRSDNFMHAVAGIGVLEGDWEFEGKHYDKCIPTFDSNVVKQQYIPEKMVCWGFNKHSSLYVNTDTLEIYSPNYSEYLGGEFEVFSSDDEALLYSKSLFPADTDTGSPSDELCEIDIDSSIPSVFYGDEVHIRQIINNFLSNAVKYTRAGKISLRLKELSRKGDNVELSVEVADTGIGIKKEDVGKLFKNFTRLDEQKNRNIEGTGLGLSLTEKLVKLMGGEINVESEYGKGSTFSVKLSQKIVNEAPVGNFSDQYNEFVNQKKENTNVIDIHDASILVVDDIEMNIQVVKGMLKKTRANIDTAYSGEECLDKIAKSHYDIIFLDHMMPEMDGIETLERMRKKDNPNTDTPVIILTANAVVGAKEMYLEKGFADYLSKPIRRDDLIDMLCRYLPKTMINVPSIENPEGNTDDNAVSIEAESETVHIGNPKNLEERFHMLDTKMGMNYCMNDEEFYVEIIETYVQNDKRQLIADAFAAENWKDYETYVHALKSTSLNIGAVELSEHAKALELAAKEGDYGYIRENHKKVFDEYSEMLDKIKENI